MRFLAKKGKLEGETDAEYLLNEMLMCEAEDIVQQMAKALYTKDAAGSNKDAWDALRTG